VAALIALGIFPNVALAQCVNTATPTCGVYVSCFAKLCPCDGSRDEYFKTYGAKYCKTFLDLPGLSPQGQAWRTSTLKCLQEAIVPLLPPDGQEATCNCKIMRSAAFDSHVKCYTKTGASICKLDTGDWEKIWKAAEGFKSVTDAEGRRQMVDVAQICLAESSVADGVKPIIRKVLDLMR